MPVSVALAATLQLLLAATFVVMLVAFHFVGPRMQQAADAEARRQGVPPAVLAEHGIVFAEGAWAFVVGYAIAAIVTALACLNLAGNAAGQLLSWIIEPLVMLGVGYVTTMQVFAARYTVRVLAKSADQRARDIDAHKVIRVASATLPSWYRPVTVVRWILATLGSVLVMVLLAMPSATAYFR
ncbi:hypothetical protein [Nocardia altamirensis]|uniref:hypothetical protein n=1 Tax=Nocardia altamirensis TaxID=472158 RepID=UPI000840321A|nr:hypothetical protein [Nocardia altamirensis]